MVEDAPYKPRITCNLDRMYDHKSEHISYIGRATLYQSGKWRVLANVNGTLCLVEVRISRKEATCLK